MVSQASKTERVFYFRKMRSLLTILKGSRIEMSRHGRVEVRGRIHYLFWPSYNLVNRDGKIIASLFSVQNEFGIDNHYMEF